MRKHLSNSEITTGDGEGGGNIPCIFCGRNEMFINCPLCGELKNSTNRCLVERRFGN